MKARIEKKLSKRLLEIAPSLFPDAWKEIKEEPTDLAYDQGSCVSGLWCVGGGVDYWGEGQDAYSVWEYWSFNFYWHGDFPPFPDGHELEGYPDTSNFKITTINLLNLAKRIEHENQQAD